MSLVVMLWTDMPTALRDVRSQGQSGKHMLALSFSGFDPERTSGLNETHVLIFRSGPFGDWSVFEPAICRA
jgi:hypothetical protein